MPNQQTPGSDRVLWHDFIGIFMVSFAILAFELAYNKIVYVQHYGGLGYVVIGSALFGFAVAGVALTVSDRLRAVASEKLVPVCSLLAGVSMVAAYAMTNLIPLDFTAFFDRPVVTVLMLAVWYTALTLPFLFGGLAIASLLSRNAQSVSGLYAWDLIGAGLGAAVALPLMPYVGGGGLVWVAAVAAVGSAAVFAWRLPRLLVGSLALGAVIAMVGYVVAPKFDVVVHTEKRGFTQDLEAGRIMYSQWSSLGRIDVADYLGGVGMIWFDGGSMQSHLKRYESDESSSDVAFAGGMPYRLKKRNNVVILASSGGREVGWALQEGAGHVNAVELDPSIVDLVSHELDDYLGGLFNHPDVSLVNEEGRSFIRRSHERYDVIQQRSAYSVAMISSGGAASFDAYLTTVEAFIDYYEHLTDDGVISISKEHGVKLLVTVLEALDRMGVDPRERIYMEATPSPSYNHNLILIRKTPFPAEELQIIADEIVFRRSDVLYAPQALLDLLPEGYEPAVADPVGRELMGRLVGMDADEREALIETLPYHAKFATDDMPFFNKVNHYLSPVEDDALPLEYELFRESQLKFGPLPIDDLAKLVVLIEAGILSALVIFLPLRRVGKVTGSLGGLRWLILFYFSMLGAGFIALEVVLIQRFILFVGSPMVAIALVLGGLLVSAGFGSALLSKVTARRPGVMIGVFVLILLIAGLYALQMERFFTALLDLSFAMRCLVGLGVLFPLGLLLGAPFPTGLTYAHRLDTRVVAWGWALNGYMTVVGTTTVAIVIPYVGYSSMFLIGGAIYAIALLCFICMDRFMRKLPAVAV